MAALGKFEELEDIELILRLCIHGTARVRTVTNRTGAPVRLPFTWNCLELIQNGSNTGPVFCRSRLGTIPVQF